MMKKTRSACILHCSFWYFSHWKAKSIRVKKNHKNNNHLFKVCQSFWSWKRWELCVHKMWPLKFQKRHSQKGNFARHPWLNYVVNFEITLKLRLKKSEWRPKSRSYIHTYTLFWPCLLTYFLNGRCWQSFCHIRNIHHTSRLLT